MKTIPTALTTHYAQGTTTLAHLLKITRPDGLVYAFTSSDDNVTVDGVIYTAATGLDISSITTSAGLAVDNLELTTLDDGTTFVRSDVLSGKWRNAAFVISRVNRASPTDGVDTLMVGTIGEVQLGRGYVTAELRGLQQYLQQPVGNVTTKTCRARLGDALCTKALGPLTISGTITSVTNQQTFAATLVPSSANDYIGEGSLTFTSGACAGLTVKVKSQTAGGAIGLMLPMIPAVAVGNTFTAIAGCRHRLAEDCATKFNNVLNFQGEPHLPGLDALTRPA